MICKRCGRTLPDGSKFCTNCGAMNSLSQTDRTGQLKVNGKNSMTQTKKIAIVAMGILALGVCVFILIKIFSGNSNDKILFHGTEFGMSMSEARTVIDLGSPYETMDSTLWYNSYSAVTVDNASIGAEIHFDFNDAGKLYLIRYEFEEASSADLELVAKYINDLYHVNDTITLSDGSLGGTISLDGYNVSAKGHNIYLESMEYSTD